MKNLMLLLPFLLLIACAGEKKDATPCAPADTLVVSNLSFECTNTTDVGGKYKVIAIVGGNTTITDAVAYKADLKSKFSLAKSRATKVLYFSSPQGTATVQQMAAAQEAVIEDIILTYDLFSASISKPDAYTGFVSSYIAQFR